MADLDIAGDIAALRSTFADIKAVADVDRLAADIERLSEEAGAPDLWDDPDAAQQVTSRLSHAQTAGGRLFGKNADPVHGFQSGQDAGPVLLTVDGTIDSFQGQD